MIGKEAFSNNITGRENVVIGESCMQNAVGVNENVVIGNDAAYASTTATGMVIIVRMLHGRLPLASIIPLWATAADLT